MSASNLKPEAGNRLSRETSPYLLQHAADPVDWYPWGEEVWARARAEDKPVFLSVGYSTCHWCHVMERESFAREDVAAILNAYFLAVKVDREERPDLDELYLNATQLLTGTGGWPNSVWLTPDGRPWFAGAYFPREDFGNQPGFKTLLWKLAEIWRTRRPEVEAQADRLTQALRQLSAPPDLAGPGDLSRDLVTAALDELRRDFDLRHASFGAAPKFPPHAALRLLLYEARQRPETFLLQMATRTLLAMASGGIHDQLAGGFHRYSTDAEWLVPHFEKMLYDNALLLRAYADAYLLSGNEEFRRVAAGIGEWALGEMRGPEGAFYSALDADSEGEEGKYYLWTREEILEALGPEDGERFSRVFGVEPEGNFRDPLQGEKSGANILRLARPWEEAGRAEAMPLPELRAGLERSRELLLARRRRRVRPRLDDKVLTAWNGLMLGSLAYAGKNLPEPRYLEAAAKAAGFILATLRREGQLLHSFRAGQARLDAFLDDYAFLADGLLDLFEASGEARWLAEAASLAETMLARFGDEAGAGFYFTAADQEDLLARFKDPLDKGLPSGNGVAARVLVRLGAITGEPRYRERAWALLESFLGLMQRAPAGAQSLILAAAMHLDAAGAPQPVRPPASPGMARPGVLMRKKPLFLEAWADRATVVRGETLEVTVRVALDDGWHLNSAQPRSEDLVPTRLALKPNPRAVAGKVVYPPGQELRLAFSPEPLSGYEAAVEFKVPIRIADDAPAGGLTLEFELSAQACNQKSCLAAETHKLSLALEVGGEIANDGVLT